MTLQELKSEAETLCDQEKGALAADLLNKMSPSDYWVSDEEVLDRVKELESGEVEEISFNELKRRLGR